MPATPRTHRAELAASEARLLAMLEQPDSWAQEPSSLPGWSRNHVVAHPLGNLEGMINLTRWASSGTKTPMYPSLEQKDAAIAAKQPEFAHACESLTEPLPERHLTMVSGAHIGAWQLPSRRRCRTVQSCTVSKFSFWRG